LNNVSFGEVSVRNAEEEEARVVQEWERDGADDLQDKRRKRVDLLEDELAQLQKVSEALLVGLPYLFLGSLACRKLKG